MIPTHSCSFAYKTYFLFFLHLFVSAFALLLFFATAAVVLYVLVAVESLDPAANPKTSLKSEFTLFQSLSR